MTSDHAEYVGSLPGLKGKRALVRPHLPTQDLTLEDRRLLAQFNDFGLLHPETGEDLSLDWHLFTVTDFKLLVAIRG